MGFDGGRTVVDVATNGAVVGNRAIEFRYGDEGGLRVEVRDVVGHRVVRLESPFSVLFADGSIVRADQMRMVERPVVQDLKVDAGASRRRSGLVGRVFARYSRMTRVG